MKTIIHFLCTLLAISSLAGANKHETWTSSVGSQIEGTYLGSVDSTHWIASSAGQLFKLNESQLSKESIDRIREINETTQRRAAMHLQQSSLIPAEVSPKDEDLITKLCSTKVPFIKFKSTPIASALESLNEITGAEIPFRIEANAQNREVNMQLRNLYMNQILNFLTQQVGLYYRVESGVLVIRDQHN
ncbi:hypothetical protein [Coraliomargarita akajimensis]|uniref:Uncharacterized protein n=1 Tax=Coraliomargarita akajimensis (strain DSM 45221 / IAM 15411 / JCM 23193 / KCTC 12865 / 04OKA010-24) TaxID=583355 RepID=D5EI53_CORAD|nr:hypothetical protein [Coraliomargarita akajimensis]ADE56093.1 hypothetical protein Caka_3080 [Coraliomargarita akajimensis DSM 45221]